MDRRDIWNSLQESTTTHVPTPGTAARLHDAFIVMATFRDGFLLITFYIFMALRVLGGQT